MGGKTDAEDRSIDRSKRHSIAQSRDSPRDRCTGVAGGQAAAATRKPSESHCFAFLRADLWPRGLGWVPVSRSHRFQRNINTGKGRLGTGPSRGGTLALTRPTFT